MYIDATTRKAIHDNAPCRLCEHMALTYQNDRPYVCHKFGFMSKNYPNLEVYSSTGMICAGYSPRNNAKE